MTGRGFSSRQMERFSSDHLSLCVFLTVEFEQTDASAPPLS